MNESEHIADKALRIALAVHTGQTDRYGKPYILHVLSVGMQGKTDIEIAAGFLHDVIEDSNDWTIERLTEEGFPEEVLHIVDRLTKRDGEEWDNYINRVLTHAGAMRVKLYDLEHNMNAQRIPEFGEKEYERFQRYVRAWQRITSELNRLKTDRD